MRDSDRYNKTYKRKIIGRGAASRVDLVLTALVLASLGCGGSQGAQSPEEDHRIYVDTHIKHEPCEPSQGQVQRYDLDHDGSPELTVVNRGGKELCRIVDLNFDGTPEAWAYNDSNGRVRRRESDFDRDGRVDEIAIYQGGVLVSKQLATSLQGRLDTWQFYTNGKLTKTQRDANGDSFLDQWWEYPNPSKPECPLVHTDVDGDGRPDPGATVDVCASDESEVDVADEHSALDPGGMDAPLEETESEDSGDDFEDGGEAAKAGQSAGVKSDKAVPPPPGAAPAASTGSPSKTKPAKPVHKNKAAQEKQ